MRMRQMLCIMQTDASHTSALDMQYTSLNSHTTSSIRSPTSTPISTSAFRATKPFLLSLLLLFILLLTTTVFTPTHCQHLSPDSLGWGRVQVQFPSVDSTLLMDSQYMTPGVNDAYILYQSIQPDSLTLNLTFLANLSSLNSTLINTAGASLLIGLVHIPTNMPVGLEQNVTIAQHPSGSALVTLTNLTAQLPYYIYIEHSYALNMPYCIVVTTNSSRIQDSPNVLSALSFRQLPNTWQNNGLASPSDASLPMTTIQRWDGLASQPTYTIRPSRGAFTYELALELRRVSDCTVMNDQLSAKGINTLRAYWLRPAGQPITNYFQLAINSTNSPAMRVPPPDERYKLPYGLVVDGLAYGTKFGALILFYPPFRATQWTIDSQYGGADTRLHDDFDSLTEEQYATQVTVYNFILSRQQSYLIFDLVQDLGGQQIPSLTWTSASSVGETNPRGGNLKTKVMFPVQDPQMKLQLTTPFGQNITWYFTRQPIVPNTNTTSPLPVVNQTQVLQSYQVYQSDLVLASKNLVGGNTTDQFQTISQDGVSYVALQRFTSNHTITAAIPVSDFRSKTISVTVKPTVNNATLKRDVYMIATTPNPLVWVKPEPSMNVSQEMELIPDSSAVSVTLSEIDGKSLTNTALNQGNLTKLTSYSYSITQSYDTVDSCPSATSCVPECRIYDPATSQWIRSGITTQIVSVGTVRCFSSTPGTIALLRTKIVTRTDVDPSTDVAGLLTYSTSSKKNDLSIAIALLIITGILFILLCIGGVVTFMRETRSMQQQINDLKKAMMDDHEREVSLSLSLEREEKEAQQQTRENSVSNEENSNNNNHNETEESGVSEISFLPPASFLQSHLSLSLASRHLHDVTLGSPSAQLSLLAYSNTPGSGPQSLAATPMTSPQLQIQISMPASPAATANVAAATAATTGTSTGTNTTTTTTTTTKTYSLKDLLPFPRVSQLAPQFRPLTEAELVMKYGNVKHDTTTITMRKTFEEAIEKAYEQSIGSQSRMESESQSQLQQDPDSEQLTDESRSNSLEALIKV